MFVNAEDITETNSTAKLRSLMAKTIVRSPVVNTKDIPSSM